MLGSLDLDIGDQSPKRKTDEKEFIDKDKLLNFNSVRTESKATMRLPFFETETSKLHSKTAFEVDNWSSELLMSELTDPGTYLSKNSTSTTTSEKSYCLFVAPIGDSLQKICKTYIGHGNSVCTVKNCTKNHRKTEKMVLEEGQLCVAKYKEAISFGAYFEHWS